MTETQNKINEKEDRDISAPPEPKTHQAIPERPEADTRCANHLDKNAFRVCSTCGRNFCVKCVVHYFGLYYCEPCGSRLQDNLTAPSSQSAATDQNIPGSEAGKIPDPRLFDKKSYNRSFRLSLFSLIPLLGLVVGVIALFIGFGEISRPKLQPGKGASQKPLYAVLIAAASIILQTIGITFVLVLIAG